MRDFSRQPTRGERALGAVLTFVLAALTAALAVFLALRDFPIGAAVCGLVTAIWAVMFYRAAFGRARALRRSESRVLAWVLLVVGLLGFAIVGLVEGPARYRLMILGGAITMFAAGLAGVRSRGQDT